MKTQHGEPEPSAEEAALADGLAAVIDRMLERHPAGDTFLYGIHQTISPGMLTYLRRHFRRAGWAQVTVREGATGAHLLVLSGTAADSSSGA